MKLYKFKGRAGSPVALTKDKTGANLPQRQHQWIYVSTINVQAGDKPRIGASSSEIIEGINKNGYFIWPVYK